MTVRDRSSAFQMRGSKLTNSVPKLEAFPHREGVDAEKRPRNISTFVPHGSRITERWGGSDLQSAIAHMYPAMTRFSGNQLGGNRFWSFQTQQAPCF